MKAVKKSFSGLVFIFAALVGQAQSDSLDSKFDRLITTSETYQNFKVIPITRINEFWGEVMDTLQNKEQKIATLEAKTNELQAMIEDQSKTIQQLQQDLEKARDIRDSIEFAGIEFSKTGYHVMVWAIIIILLVAAAFSFYLYQRSHKVTARANKDYQKLQQEFEAHKDNAREKQVKLKRELQTAVNTLEEVRRGKSK